MGDISILNRDISILNRDISHFNRDISFKIRDISIKNRVIRVINHQIQQPSTISNQISVNNHQSQKPSVINWKSHQQSVINNQNHQPSKSSIISHQISSSRRRSTNDCRIFFMTNTFYEKAISLLQERYEQTHKIIQTYMQALLDIPPPLNTMDSLRIYYDKMETYVRGLESLGQTDDTYGSLLVPIILNKLPGEIRKNLAREHKWTNWILSDLRRAICDELNIMEAGNSTERLEMPMVTAAFLTHTNARETKPAHTETDKTAERPGRNTKECAFCKEHDHSSTNCTIFKTVADRLSIVKRDRLCFNCLGRHKIADCKSTNNGRKCDKRHHTSICKIGKEGEKEETKSGTINDVHQSSKTEGVLLKSAITKVRTGDQTTKANILLDEGAQTSFITEALADKHNVKTHGEEEVQLNSFGDNGRQVSRMKTAIIYLQTEGEEIGINVLVIPQIAAPIETHIKSVANMPHLRDLKLAHPASAEISLI